MNSFAKELQKIKQKKFDKLYLFHGDESYFIDELTKALEENVLTESEKSFNFSLLYGKDVDVKIVMDHVGQYPMMASKRLVVIREAQNMKDLSDLEPYIKNPVDTSILVIAHKHKKVDGRSGFAKLFKKHGTILESKKLYDNKVPDWIAQNIRDRGFNVGRKAVMLLTESVGNNISNIISEIDKLVLNLNQGEMIQTDHIEKYIGISKTFNVFELQRAIGLKNHVVVFKIINHFEVNPKSNPIQMIIGLMYSYFAKLFILSQNRGLSGDETAKLIGLGNTYFLKEYTLALQNYSGAQLRSALLVLSEYDLKSKGVNAKNIPQMSLLRELVYKIME